MWSRAIRSTLLLSCACVLLFAPAARAKDVVLRPALPTNRVLVYIHGSGGGADDISRSAQAAWLNHGFTVVASDADGPQNWGNPASVADYEHLIDRVGLDRVFLIAGSMGGLDAMQLIGSVDPEAVILSSPVCDLSRLGIISPVAIEQAWGKSRPAYLSPVIPDPEPSLPVDIWASPEDTWVPKRTNADVCARELRERGAHVNEFPDTGDHPEASPKGSEMLGFFLRIAEGERRGGPAG